MIHEGKAKKTAKLRKVIETYWIVLRYAIHFQFHCCSTLLNYNSAGEPYKKARKLNLLRQYKLEKLVSILDQA